jgi:hypothetical protein
MNLQYWRDLLGPVFQGRKAIVALQSAAGATQTVRDLLAFGAAEVLVVATNIRGIGTLPTEVGAQLIELNSMPVDSQVVVSDIRTCQNAIRNLSAWAIAEIENFDPSTHGDDRNTLAIGDFLTETSEIAGRPFLFYRQPEWLALDDKTTIDALWDACDIPRSPSLVTQIRTNTIRSAFAELNQGNGVVVAIDSADGWTGGAEGIRWVHTDEELVSTPIDQLLPPAWSIEGRTCRVMPFLEGIPCSIHGVVFDEYVMALRPVEMVVLRQMATDSDKSRTTQFFYAGCASFWDPTNAHREEMRDIARRVGTHLRAAVGFRGAFTVDGVMTHAGFRPTELNPRNGAGLLTMLRAFPDQASGLILDCTSSQKLTALSWRPEALEAELLNSFDGHRAGGTWKPFRQAKTSPPPSGRLTISDGHVQWVAETEPADLTFVSNTEANGRVNIRCAWNPLRTVHGPSTAPQAATFWNWAETEFGLGLRYLSAATEQGQPEQE